MSPLLTPLGVVLAGGSSRRFGQDKALVPLQGEALVRRAVNRVQQVTPEVVLADRGRGLLAEVVSVEDGPGGGPAAGLLGVARAYPGRSLLVLACDLPSVPRSLLEALVDSEAGGERRASRVPRHGTADAPRLEPLCALYRPAELQVLARRVESSRLALHRWLEDPRVRVGFLEGRDLLKHGEPQEVFFNLNRPQDLERWLAGKERRSAADGQEDVGP